MTNRNTPPNAEQVFIRAAIGSLFHSLVEVEIHVTGEDTIRFHLDEGMEIVKAEASPGVEVLDGRLVIISPQSAGNARASIWVRGSTGDTHWRNYPLMLGLCDFGLTIQGNACCRFFFEFPKYMHPLQYVAKFVADGVEQGYRASNFGYPEVQLGYAYEVEVGGELSVKFQAQFREGPMTLIASVVVPFIINSAVITLAYIWSYRTSGIGFHIPLVVGVLPLYVTLWNFSNTLKAGPIIINMITTAMAVTILTNLLLGFTWVVSDGSASLVAQLIGAILVIGYATWSVIVMHNVFRFIWAGHVFVAQKLEGVESRLPLFALQRLLHDKIYVPVTDRYKQLKHRSRDS